MDFDRLGGPTSSSPPLAYSLVNSNINPLAHLSATINMHVLGMNQATSSTCYRPVIMSDGGHLSPPARMSQSSILSMHILSGAKLFNPRLSAHRPAHSNQGAPMAAAAIEKKKPVFTKVDQLRPDTSGHNLTVKVLDAKLVLDRPARPGGKPQRIAECTVGDDTGIILFTARNEQVDLMKSGNFVILRNAKIDMFRGSMRLAVNQWGKIEPAAEGTSFTPKTDNNLSLVEYELVQVPSDHS